MSKTERRRGTRRITKRRRRKRIRGEKKKNK
jgi:hypothetical protein